ncbi:MAG: hypothetical protein LC126_30180 [Bryobacterales bacterium]|nr:hypothetical protein [Bryobacterales bacterium]
MARTILFVILMAAAASQTASCQTLTLWVTDSASLQFGMPRGGALATIFLSGLEGKPGLYTAPPAGPLPFRLAGLQVLVNGALAPILAVYIPREGEKAQAQINFQVPLERNATLHPDGTTDLLVPIVLKPGITSLASFFPPAPFGSVTFGGFFQDEKGYAIAEHASDHRRVTIENPAHAGETITAYGNDLFSVWPPPPIGFSVPQEPRFEYSAETTASFSGAANGHLYLQEWPTSDPFVTHTPALKVLFQGLAVGQIGVQRVDFVVPPDQAPGDWPLFYNVGSCPNGQGEG